MSFKTILASAAALAMVAGTPAFAAKNQNPQALASEQGGGAGVDAKGERKVCRYVEKTQSRMGRQRLCLTKDEWRKVEEELR